jgi:hypothetical protein
MVINCQNVKADNQDRVYIKYAGVTLLKVHSVTMGTSSNNNQQVKVHFQDKNENFITDTFVLTPNALWKIKLLAQALEVPADIVNTDHFAGRYAEVTIKEKKTQNNGVIFEINKYEATKANKPFQAPQAEVVYQDDQVQQKVEELKQEMQIDEDEIPF